MKTIECAEKILTKVVKLADKYDVDPSLAWAIMQYCELFGEDCCAEDDECNKTCVCRHDDDDDAAYEECDEEAEAEVLECEYTCSSGSDGKIVLPNHVVDIIADACCKYGDGETIYITRKHDVGEVMISYAPTDEDSCTEMSLHTLKHHKSIGVKTIFGENADGLSIDVYKDGDVVIY